MHTHAERYQQLSEALAAAKTPKGITVRSFAREDFPILQSMTAAEGWTTPSERPDQTLSGWLDSWPVLVAEDRSKEVIGFLRAMTDGEISTYVGELIVARNHRGAGVGKLLIAVCGLMYPRTRIDLLTDSADGFYRSLGCREFRGYRVHPVAFR
ncbi:MAG: GNAT family N-acetyltransferase [Gemmatimonadetes bacterium]|jgi:ribosomal protein S18 acetylase RimI-like enzyme|nr:GNAT family N-acetyltransferase [Gemmatimonadota bacterium]MBT4610767.1 GNAT family N-acetyltransferase [Gemmatimonadota bacterium]MBT5057710.1 GNAT family N-acetyltransferase [Gemmatimonadota bacterium]MBT5141378.1 GNAT family N-acetyltransferase [Gemmatimonadota bacterium]MBT5590459.1 GNAT family N-acetyltransferase [Gemmatimonadota bacterium]